MEERLRRYLDKIELISRRSSEAEEWTRMEVRDFVKDEKTKLATYKAFQEIVEASFDIVAMMLKDVGVPPKDDHTNAKLLVQSGLIDEKMAGLLAESNGLRNRLVHGYNILDEEQAFDSIRRLMPGIREFKEKVRKWLQGRAK